MKDINYKNIFDDIINGKYTCLQCNTKLKTFQTLVVHYKNKHNIKLIKKEYLKIISEGTDELFLTLKQKANEKRKQTCIKKYGVECISKSAEIKNKIQETCIKKYGTQSTLSLPQVKNAREKALIEQIDKIVQKRKNKQTPEILEDALQKRKQTCIKKYGVENIFRLKSTKEKIKETLLKKYGVECGANILDENGITKGRNTLFENYGVHHPAQSEIIQEKAKKTFFKKYGSYHYLSSDKRRKYYEKYYGWTSKEEWENFKLYYNEVWKETNKHKKILYKNWNGKCYYTNEILLIDKNKCNEKLAATIDHKISISYGFKNNISSKEIGKKENLCICSRYINTIKNYMTEEQFQEKLKVIKENLKCQ